MQIMKIAQRRKSTEAQYDTQYCMSEFSMVSIGMNSLTQSYLIYDTQI